VHPLLYVPIRLRGYTLVNALTCGMGVPANNDPTKIKIAIAKELASEPKTVLDYGCSIGLLKEFLGIYYSNAPIYAVDISEDSLAHIHHHYPGIKALDCESALRQSFDLIVVSRVLHHVPIDDR